MIKLIAFDLDGTFLTDMKEITEENFNTMVDAGRHGVFLVPITGRPFKAIPQEVLDMPGVRYVVASSGADIRDMAENKRIRRDVLDTDYAVSLLQSLRDAGFLVMAFVEGVGYVSPTDMKRALVYARDEGTRQYLMKNRVVVDDIVAYVRDRHAGLEKFTLSFPWDDKDQPIGMDKGLDFVKAYEDKIHVVHGGHIGLEAGSVTAEKGCALEFLGEYLGIAADEMMAIGDSGNDIDMRKSVGTFVAMGNASEELKKAADYITATNEENGVAQAVRHYLSGKECL